ncbi:hypothetical protein D3C77_192920 [compost metagenome]
MHALVGADGDVCRVLRRVADLLYRGHHLADHRLQLAQKGIEAFGDRAQFIGAVAAKAAGQVAFALGDIIEHGDHLAQRTGDALGQQPDHQQAQGRNAQAHHGHAGEVGTTLGAEFILQFIDVGHDRAQRQLQQQGPAGVGVADLEGQVQLDAVGGLVHLVAQGFSAELAQGGSDPRVEGLAGFCTELARVFGERYQAAVARYQRQLAGTVVQLLIGGIEQFLDEVHRQVSTGDALERAIDHDRLDE